MAVALRRHGHFSFVAKRARFLIKMCISLRLVSIFFNAFKIIHPHGQR
jgi:hypothetical protein